ncbi:hypothetical protein Q4485_05405 [Granulosicoccaceae sp. 1_MG-2023]|nr:hypothetical protein [Granulosicoccaceae sp. 1_MG-2023]
MKPLMRCRLIRAGLIFLLFMLVLWPSFVLVSTAMGYWLGDGIVVSRYTGEPRRLMLAALTGGYAASLPQAAGIALVATGLLWLFSHRFVTLMLSGLAAAVFLLLVYLFTLPFSLANSLILILVAVEFLLLLMVGGYWMRRCRG